MISRRKFLTYCFSSVVIAHGFIQSAWARVPWQAEHFSEGTLKDTFAQLFPEEVKFKISRKIKFSRLPRTAENGAIVPLTIDTSLENVTKISIFVEKNLIPLSAEFYLSEFMQAHVSARLRMAHSGKVIVIIEADGIYYKKTQRVKVTQGGCGG